MIPKYKIISEQLPLETAQAFFDGNYKEVAYWKEGEGRASSEYTIYTNGEKFLLQSEHFGFEDWNEGVCHFIELIDPPPPPANSRMPRYNYIGNSLKESEIAPFFKTDYKEVCHHEAGFGTSACKFTLYTNGEVFVLKSKFFGWRSPVYNYVELIEE